MPSCPTKSFAESRCLRASPRLRPSRVPATRLSSPTPRKQKNVLAKLRSWVAKWLTAPSNVLRKLPSSASRHGAPRLKKTGAIPSLRGDRRRVLRPWGSIALAALLCNFAAHAQGTEAARQFEAGSNAFKAHNYAAALEAFQAAVAAGLSGPAVHFNIGVSAFHLGQYSRARAAFDQVARTPAMAALAHYNIGLVALRRDETEEAASWFARAESEAADERLRTLAGERLAEIASRQPSRDWVGYAAFGAGYDDNVALVDNSDVLGISGKEDAFSELQLAFTAPLARPWRLDGGLAWVDYQDLDRFDQLSLHGGGYYRVATGDWMNQVGLQFGYTTLDGEGFENRRTLALQTSAELWPDWQVRVRYRFNDIEGLNDFAGMTGQRHEAGARFVWAPQPWEVAVEYQFDASDYDDAALSANRHQLGLDLQRPLFNGWALQLEATRRHSRYEDRDNGTEDRTQLTLAVTKSLSTMWQLAMRYTHTSNAADLAEFDYAGNRISLGVEATM